MCVNTTTTHGDQENPMTDLDPIANGIVILTILNGRGEARRGEAYYQARFTDIKKLDCLYHFGECTIITSNIISVSCVPLANKRVRRC